MRTIILSLLVALVSLNTVAQNSRSYIRNAIRSEGNCRNVAITKYGGDLMLYGRNGCARSGVPRDLSQAITELNNKRVFIDDVQLTEGGKWLILHGNNGFRWNDIPYSLEQRLRQYNRDNEVVLSVSFNDAGNWVIISADHYSSSDSRVSAWLQEGNEMYGQLWTVCITDDCMIAVYARGFRFLGDVPQSLKNALNRTQKDVYRLKVAGDAWFFADKYGNYEYHM